MSLIRDVTLVGIVGGLLVSAAGLYVLVDSWRQTRLTPTPATVLESRIDRKIQRSKGETGSHQSWTVNIRYEYFFGGTKYVSDRFSSTPPTSPVSEPPSDELNRILAAYPIGGQVTAFVLQSNPNIALLRPREKPVWIIFAIGILVLASSLWLRIRK